MAKNNKNIEDINETDTNVSAVVKFKSDYKNLTIAGTGITFKDGIYETDVAKEIEILRNSNLVSEAGE